MKQSFIKAQRPFAVPATTANDALKNSADPAYTR